MTGTTFRPADDRKGRVKQLEDKFIEEMAASFEPEEYQGAGRRHYATGGGSKVSDSLLQEFKQKHSVEVAPDRSITHVATGPRVEVLVPPGKDLPSPHAFTSQIPSSAR